MATPMQRRSALPGNRIADLQAADIHMSEAARHLGCALVLLKAQGKTISYGQSVAETIEQWSHEIGADLLRATKQANGE